MYRVQYIVTVDYDVGDNPNAQRIAHYDFSAFVRHRIEQVKKTINDSHYHFTIKRIEVVKPKPFTIKKED